MTWLKKLSLGLRYLTYTMLLLVVLMYLINIFDADLNPEIEPLLEAVTSKTNSQVEGNGFFYSIAFFADVDDVYQRGQEITTLYEEAVKKGTKALGKYHPFGAKDRQLTIQDHIPSFSREDNPDFIGHYKENQEQIQATLAKNSTLLNRYGTLQTFPQFAAAMTPTVYTPIVSFSDIHHLFLAATAHVFVTGNSHEAYQLLNRDIGHWRKVLRGSNQVILTLSANAFIQRDLQLLSSMLGHGDQINVTAEELPWLRQSYSKAEVDLTSCFSGEFATFYRVLEDIKFSTIAISEESISGRIGLFFCLPLIQKNVLHNQSYTYLHKTMTASQLSAAELVNLPEDFVATPTNPDLFNWKTIYNPIGKILLATMLPRSPLHYSYKLHDTEGFRRLVMLQLLIKQQQIPINQVEDFIIKQGADFYNPYSLEAMQWDKKESVLTFVSATTKPNPVSYHIKIN